MTKQSPSQTVGPYFAYSLTPEDYGRKGIASNRLAGLAQSDCIRIEGRVFDGVGDAVNDAMVEIWQANGAGRYAHPVDGRDDLPLTDGFTGFGRAMTDTNGWFWFETLKPGRVPGPGNQLQAPHIGIIVFSRGMQAHVFTRLYFSDEPSNSEDPVLESIDAKRRPTLIAELSDGVYRFDIHLQGDHETVFFDA